jgi:hypothetical protein
MIELAVRAPEALSSSSSERYRWRLVFAYQRKIMRMRRWMGGIQKWVRRRDRPGSAVRRR